MKLHQYSTLVFDCDGVILNSNRVKTESFYRAALPYGDAAAQALVDYHIARGGVSRYEKFAWFLAEVVKNIPGPKLEKLLQSYASEVKSGLRTCAVADGLIELRAMTRSSNWLIVSGGDQNELREVFAERELAVLFDGGIFGSPDNKNAILHREQATGNIHKNALFIGDSQYDHSAATEAGLDFVFLTNWTEFDDWPSFFKDKNGVIFGDVSNLISLT